MISSSLQHPTCLSLKRNLFNISYSLINVFSPSSSLSSPSGWKRKQYSDSVCAPSLPFYWCTQCYVPVLVPADTCTRDAITISRSYLGSISSGTCRTRTTKIPHLFHHLKWQESRELTCLVLAHYRKQKLLSISFTEEVHCLHRVATAPLQTSCLHHLHCQSHLHPAIC